LDIGRGGGLGDQPLYRLSAEGLQDPLHDRILLWPELIGVALCKPSDDREGRELRFERAILRAQPLLDRPRHLRMLQRNVVREPMDQEELFRRLAVALAIGFLFGLGRKPTISALPACALSR